jgi:hypothetical protein
VEAGTLVLGHPVVVVVVVVIVDAERHHVTLRRIRGLVEHKGGPLWT